MSIMDLLLKCLKDKQGKLETVEQNKGLDKLVEMIEGKHLKIALITKESPLFNEI